MRVLITIDPLTTLNSIINNYLEGMSKYAEVVASASSFWTSNLKFDIINIHWPEVLVSGMDYNDNLPGLLEARLKYWKGLGTKIVITYHNRLPHKQKHLDQKVYDLIYTNTDGFIHLGDASLKELSSISKLSEKQHIVIYHPNYLDIPNSISREDARKRLGLQMDDIVFISFGNIRHQEEEDFLIEAFSKLDNRSKKKKLIIVNALSLAKRTGKAFPITRFKYELWKKKLAKRNIIIEENPYIGDDYIQIYMNAADVIISPRLYNLNSGIIFLAFSFKKIVIGPDTGNIGEFLDKQNNPKFSTVSTDSLRDMMEKSISLIDSDIAENNFQFVKNECNLYKIGKQYIDFFDLVLKEDSLNNKY